MYTALELGCALPKRCTRTVYLILCVIWLVLQPPKQGYTVHIMDHAKNKDSK